jgi:hypothetical protein
MEDHSATFGEPRAVLFAVLMTLTTAPASLVFVLWLPLCWSRGEAFAKAIMLIGLPDVTQMRIK